MSTLTKSKSTVRSAKIISLGPNKEIFRQTRHENDSEKVTMLIDKLKVDLKNWSRTGIGFESANLEKVEIGQRIEGIRLRCGDVPLYEGSIEIKSIRKLEGDRVYYGAAFASSLFLIESIDTASAVNECASEVEKVGKLTESADPEFCQSVLALSLALSQIKRTCEKEERRWRSMTFDQRCEAERVFLPNIVNKVKFVFIHFNVKISKQVDIESLSEDSIYHRIFHEEIYPFFHGADLVRRAYEKPRGYAGDYEMMNQIYRNGFEGVDLFGRVLHHYITNENSAESVKFRKPYFYGHYTHLIEKPGKHKVLSIACGPAVEFQQVVEQWTQEQLDCVHVTLFDLDREALEYAQTRIFDIAVRSGKHPHVDFINASVKSFLAANAESQERFDLIYSGGLFDYLDNLTSAALIRKFASMLNPGGTLVIGNFTKDNLTKAFLHLLTQWTLIHKTEDEMRSLANGIEGCKVSIEFDHLKMNAFLVLKMDAH